VVQFLRDGSIGISDEFRIRKGIFVTNNSQSVNVINGSNGNPIENLSKLNLFTQEPQNYHTDMILDSISGDLYTFERASNQWKPTFNCGMHSRHEAQAYQQIGKHFSNLQES
jgi:hypothetical protein